MSMYIRRRMELRFNNQQEVYNAIYSAVDQGLHEKELIAACRDAGTKDCRPVYTGIKACRPIYSGTKDCCPICSGT